MIDGRSIIGIIPARGGSKGLPRKNILPVGNKPLIAWTIAAAGGSRFIDRVVLSSEDEEIMAIADRLGVEVPFKRPENLASDTATLVDVVLHALDEIAQPFDDFVLLQPTSPLRTAADIDACIEAMHRQTAPVCVSVCAADKPPYWMFFIENGLLRPILADQIEKQNAQRQEYRPAYQVNGAVYVARIDWFRKNRTFISTETLAHVMPRERSLDVDTEIDLMVLDTLLAKEGHGALQT